ncbi:MAG: hypothetical protein MK089_08540 [Phycisphaerales bacterium]|nr:hypothetical protein [Phycisphaerales bacterium]
MTARFHGVLVGVLILMLMPSVQAQDQAAAVAQLRQQLRSMETSPELLPEILNQVLADRRILIASNPVDPEVLFWRTAQAEDALEGLQINAVELLVRHGLSATEQRDLMDALIREALDQTATIEAELPRALAEAAPNSSRRDRLESLADTQWPRLRGWALGLAAARGLAEDPDVTYREAIGLMGKARPNLRGVSRATISRQLGLAQLAIGELDLARSELEGVRRSTSAGQLDLLGARAGLVDLRFKESGSVAAGGDAQISAATSNDPFERLLLIEMAAQYWIKASKEVAAKVNDQVQAEEQRKDLEFTAVEAFLLLQPETGGIVVDQQQHLLDLMIEQRLGRLDFADPMADHLPSSVGVAFAFPLAQSPDTAQQARDMLESLLARPGLVPRQRPRVLSVLAIASLNSGDREAAIDYAIEWSQLAGTRQEGQYAAEMAADLASKVVMDRPEEQSLLARRTAAVNNLLTNFQDHPNLNKWLLQAGQWAQAIGQIKEATNHYESIEADAPERIFAIRQLAMMMYVGLDRLAAEERVQFIPEISASIESMDRELMLLSEQSPADAARVHVTIGWIKARMSLMEDSPVRALNQLSALNLDVIEPEMRAPIQIAKLEASIGTGREGAVRAVIETLPEDLMPQIARGVLPVAGRSIGWPLPLDPIEDPAMAMACVSLGRSLLAEENLDEVDLVLAVESIRRGGEPGEALKAVNGILKSSPDLATALLCKAECMHVLSGSDQAELITIYARLCKADPVANPIRFWTSQLRMLQLMKDNGRDPADVMARVNRLRQQDARLGGPPFDGQFALLIASLKDAETVAD